MGSTRLSIAAAGTLALGLLGCTVGPAYRHPTVPVPAHWQVPVAQGQGAPAPAWPSVNWWSSFGSPELDQLIREAQSANDDLAAAVARVEQAEAQVTVSGAPLYPTLDATASGTRTEALVPVPGGGKILRNEFPAELSASYELDFWGANRATRAAAVAAAHASRYARETVELTVMSSVATTYFTVLELREELTIAEDNLASAKQTLSGLKIDASVGTTTALAVAQQETEVATLSASIPPLRQQTQQALDALAILVGKVPQGFTLEGKATLESLSLPRLAPGMPSGLLARRPDVAEAEAQLVAANADIQVARAAFFPTIELTAAGGYESTALATLFEPGSQIFSIAAGLTQPIFHGREILGTYRLQKARYAELLADYRKAVISAFGNVEDALVAVRETGDQLDREKTAVATARRAYQLSQAQFHAGTISILDVLTTETALFSAEGALAQVKLARLQALVGLFNALGGGWKQ